MLDTRRCFLKNLAGVSSSFLIFQSSPPIPEPRRRTPVDPPAPAEKEDAESPLDTSRNAKRAQLQAQEKQFRETMAQLFVKVRDLNSRSMPSTPPMFSPSPSSSKPQKSKSSPNNSRITPRPDDPTSLRHKKLPGLALVKAPGVVTDSAYCRW